MPRRHWSPRYIGCRVVDVIRSKRHPDEPWLTPAANAFLDGWLDRRDHMIEFGSGRSTSWFAARVGSLVSIETDHRWLHSTSLTLEREDLSARVSLRLAPQDLEAYLAAASDGEAPYDVVLIDGKFRAETALWATEQLVGGGLLVIDDAHRYLGSSSRSPYAVRSPINVTWESVQRVTTGWRSHWTSNGVSDTVLIFKPCGVS